MEGSHQIRLRSPYMALEPNNTPLQSTVSLPYKYCCTHNTRDSSLLLAHASQFVRRQCCSVLGVRGVCTPYTPLPPLPYKGQQCGTRMAIQLHRSVSHTSSHCNGATLLHRAHLHTLYCTRPLCSSIDGPLPLVTTTAHWWWSQTFYMQTHPQTHI